MGYYALNGKVVVPFKDGPFGYILTVVIPSFLDGISIEPPRPSKICLEIRKKNGYRRRS